MVWDIATNQGGYTENILGGSSKKNVILTVIKYS